MDNAHQSGFQAPDPSQSTRQSLNDVLVPYAKVNGEWSLPDEFILSLAYQMREEGTFTSVFYNGEITSPEAVLALMQRPTNLPVFAFTGSEPTAMAWLNGISGGIAFAHFCTFAAAKGRTVEIGQRVVSFWEVNFKPIRAILGLTPANNKLALRYIKSLGFTVIGTIPKLLVDAYHGELVGGTISYRSSGDSNGR